MRAFALALLLLGCASLPAGHRPARTEDRALLELASAEWRARGLRYPAECRKDLAAVRIVVAAEAQFRRLSGGAYCPPGMCPGRVPHASCPLWGCAASYLIHYRERWFFARPTPVIVISDRLQGDSYASALIHEWVHQLEQCAYRLRGSRHDDARIWGPEGVRATADRQYREGRRP